MSDSKQVLAWDKAHVWRPYTPMQEFLATGEPLVIESARGSRFVAADGREYIDGNSSWWCSTLGHQHPRLVAAYRADQPA